MIAAGANPDAEIHRACEHYRAGRAKQAAACLVSAIKARPASIPPYKLLADVQKSLGNRVAERAVLEELALLEPMNAATWNRLGAIHLEGGRSDDAYRASLRACRLMPGGSGYWEGLAAAAFAAQRFSCAVEATDQLLKRFPNNFRSQLFAGHINKAEGNFEQSRAAYDAALAIDPSSCEAIYNRVDLEPPAPSDPLALRIEQMLLSPHLSDADTANLHFSMVRILDAANQFDSAFAHCEKANAAMLRLMATRGIGYRRSDSEARLEHTLATYTASAFRYPLEPVPINLRLIFIVGMPRSGTSIIEQIISSHPQVTAGGELSIACDSESLYLQRRKELGLQGPIDTQVERERELLLDIRHTYVDRLLERGLDAQFVTDKAPGNFARVAFVRLLFPDAIVVHSGRNPIATCWSLFASNFAIHDPYYNSLEHLVHYYRSYERLMAHWRSVLVKPMLEMRYEELVSNPEFEIKRLIEGAGLDWNEECMVYHKNRRPVLTASHSQVRRKMYLTSTDHWRHYESHLGVLKELVI